jgi:electron transport complex protein RnfE
MELPAAPPMVRSPRDLQDAVIAGMDGSPFHAPRRLVDDAAHALERWTRGVTSTSRPQVVVRLDPPGEAGVWLVSVLVAAGAGEPVPIDAALRQDRGSRTLTAEWERLGRAFPAIARVTGPRRGQLALTQDQAWELMTTTGPMLATIAVLLISNTLAALIGRWLLPEVRIAVFVVVIAAAVTAVELTLAAWLPAIHAGLGIFLPLIVTNCLVLARAESFAARNAVGSAMLDALAMGVGFMLVLLALGASRELLGHGSLGAGLDDVLGPAWSGTRIEVFPERHGLLLVLLPPGAFILLGLMLAIRNRLAQRRQVQRGAAIAVGESRA